MCIFSGGTSWVNRLLFVISVASFSKVGWREVACVTACCLTISYRRPEAVTSDPKCVKIKSLFMRDMDSCMDMVKGLSLCLDSHVNLLEQTIALYPM